MKNKRAASYASEMINEHGERPQLEVLLQRATEQPRPFDIVIAFSPEILGTPEDIQITRARLAEHGVELVFVHEKLP